MSSTQPPADAREALLRLHLEAASEYAVLSDEEELEAAADVAEARVAENELAQLGARVFADLDEVGRLRESLRAGDDARAALIGSSRRLVVALARRHDAPADRTAALLAAGDEALSRAVDRYDPTGGLPFSAFARWWVERAMREVEREPTSSTTAPTGPVPADPVLLTALGHLHRDDCRVVELRLGLNGGPALSSADTAQIIGMAEDQEREREEVALAKLRHPSTPGVLTHLRRL